MSETKFAEDESTKRLANTPVFTLFMQTAVPICIGMLVIGLYGVVDGIFIARWVGADAIGAVSMVFPAQMLISSIGAMVASGTATILTRLIGEKKLPEAGQIAGNSVLLVSVFSILFFVVGMWQLDSVLEFLAVPPVFYPLAYDYAQPIIVGGAIAVLLPVIGDVFRAEGKAKIMMLLMLTSSVLNIILDYIFIVLLGWGVSGAAWATIIAQLVSLTIAVSLYLRGGTLVRFSFGLHLKFWGSILALGIPVLIAQMGMAIQTGLVNYQFTFMATEEWISAYGILGRLSIFIILPMIAMLISFQTICGFNLGASAFERVQESIKVSLTAMVVYSSLVTVALLVIPEWLLGIFTTESVLIDYGKVIIFATIWGLPLAGINMLATGFYQAKGNAKLAMLYSLLRVVLIMSPLLLILPHYFGMNGIFLAIVAADVFSAVITFLFCFKEYRNLSSPELSYVDVK
ncbi:MATE family efflux transporter [Vibrio nigripulchritudo]|uniref:MATE family efflux transporter n=1 Tax=Vibrio nigripulchritudo TaxID=28173 RepID=UPI0003B17CE6|nr:MATE family efflux transporter [Vibrio nigripulchritudo]CCN70129.1 putative Multi antimicrobial extrusion protein MatE [Vibrio nigripulchritudo SFn118]